MISACTLGNFKITQWIQQFSWTNNNNGVFCGHFGHKATNHVILFVQSFIVVVLNSISGHSYNAPVLTDFRIELDYGCCIVLELVSLSKTQSSHNYLYKLRMNYRNILCIKFWTTENQREQNLPINAKWIKDMKR